MGTPEKVTEKVSLSPSVAEKRELLNILGENTGKLLELSRIGELHALLEEARKTLLPLIEWLDRPLGNEGIASFFPESFQKKRAVILYQSNRGSFIVGLERSGQWLISLDSPKNMREDDSRGLVDSMFSRWEVLIEEVTLMQPQDIQDLLKKFDFLKRMLDQQAISGFFHKCHEAVVKLMKEREDRIQAMRQRTDLFRDFIETLDPLKSTGRILSIPEYTIQEEHSRGSSVITAQYFSPQALKPIWEIIKKRPKGNIDKFTERNYGRRISSLEDLRWFVTWLFREITKEPRPQLTIEGDKGLSRDVRLPLLPEEIEVLKDLAQSISR